MQNNLLRLWFLSTFSFFKTKIKQQHNTTQAVKYDNGEDGQRGNGLNQCGLSFYGQLSGLVPDLTGIFLNGWRHCADFNEGGGVDPNLILITICPSVGPTKVLPPAGNHFRRRCLWPLNTDHTHCCSTLHSVWAIQNSQSIPEPLPQPHQLWALWPRSNPLNP